MRRRICDGFDLEWTDPIERCPDVFLIEVFGGQHRRTISRVRTVYRLAGEADDALWKRTLEEAKSLAGRTILPWETVGCIHASTMTVEQAMQRDDERENQRRLLFSFLRSDLADIRVLGASLLVQFYGLDKP